jgi:hypothetical protein
MMMRPLTRETVQRMIAVAALLFLCVGCVSEREKWEETEQILIAAGFKMQPAETPERQMELATLPPHQVLSQQLRAGGGRQATGYVYADPDVCHCVFIGDDKAYQAFAQLSLQKKLADEYREASEMAENAAFNWDMWGPGFWGAPPVVVIHEHVPPPVRQ